MPNAIEQALADAELTIEFQDNRERELWAQFAVSEVLRDFLETQAGRVLQGQAIQDYNECLEQIGAIAPTSPQNIEQLNALHIRKQAIEAAVNWLCETLKVGLAAEQTMAQDARAKNDDH